jgi:predicted transcriptional regulator
MTAHPILVIRQIRSLADAIGCEVRLIPRDKLTDCERDCLSVVEESGTVITTAAILEVLEQRNLLWGESTVRHALARLVHLGLLQSSRRAPRGYRMPE